MINYDGRIQMMISNIIEKANCIKYVCERDGSVHPDYVLEKLKSAKRDLESLISIANRR